MQEKKRSPRSVLKLDSKLLTDAGIKAYQDGLISVVDRVAPVIELICETYNEGRFNGVVTKLSDYSMSKGAIKTSHIDKDLKNQFGIRAYQDRIIKHPRYAVRLIELLLKKYIYGDLDVALNKKLKKNG